MSVLLHTFPCNLGNHFSILYKQRPFPFLCSNTLANTNSHSLSDWCLQRLWEGVCVGDDGSFTLGYGFTSVWPSFSKGGGGLEVALPPLASFPSEKKMSASKLKCLLEHWADIPDFRLGHRYLLLLGLINPVPEGGDLQTTYMTRVFKELCQVTWFPHGEGSGLPGWSSGDRCLWWEKLFLFKWKLSWLRGC